MNFIGNYKIKDFSPNRQLLSETYDFFLKKHYMSGYITVDITTALQLIENHFIKTGNKISLTSWVVKCLSRNIERHPQFNSFRKGKNKIIEFEEIDVIVMIEREIKNSKVPIAYSVRNTQEKDLLKITKEIRDIQTKEVTEKEQLLDKDNKVKYFRLLPKFLRKILMKRYINNPFTIKKNGGLIVVTSVGMFVNIPGWISGFGGLTTINLSIGGITPTLQKKGNDIIEIQNLHLTISFDHDLLDGGPAARFTQEFVEDLQQGSFLTDINY